MTKTYYILLGIGIIVLLIVLYWFIGLERTVTIPPKETATPSATNTSSPQLPNPASAYCVDVAHGTLEIVNTSAGQIGICHLPDGGSCEEWDLYRTGNCTLPEETQPEVVPPWQHDKGGQ